MTRNTPLIYDREAATIALWSAAGGLVTVLVTAAVSGRLLLDERAADATTLGALGFTIALAAPFVAAGASLVHPSLEVRRAACLAAAVLSLLLATLTIFSGVGWLFGVAGLGLLIAWRRPRPRAERDDAMRSIALTGWLVLWLGAALAALWLRETPACWNDSVTGAGWAAARTSGACASDIIDDTEGLLAITCVALGLAGLAWVVRMRGEEAIDPSNNRPAMAPSVGASSTH